MDDKVSLIEIVSEPSIESRFGFKSDPVTKSKRTRAIWIGVVVVVLGSTFFFKAPDKSNGDDSGIRTPEPSDVSPEADATNLQTYSAARDTERASEKKKNGSKHQVVLRLPGIESIGRKIEGEIAPDTLVAATLITGATSGTVRARLKESLLSIRGETILAAGSIISGLAEVKNERLCISFTKARTDDGVSTSVQAQAIDGGDKASCVRGSRLGTYAIKTAEAVGLDFVGGMSDGLEQNTYSGGAIMNHPDAKNALLNGTSLAATDLAHETMEGLRSQPISIRVDAGTEILISFDSIQ